MKKIALLLAAAMLLSCFAGCKPTDDPNPSESVVPSTGVTESAVTDPAQTDPAPTDPVATEPVSTDPAPTEPVTTEPAPTDPVPTESAPTDPAVTEPAPTDPPATEPAPTDPPATEPADELAEPQFLPGPTLVDQYGEYITTDEIDLRKLAVEYMYAMANIQWTAGIRMDYSSYAAKSLIYEPGKTYLGMVYNNNATGLEMFLSILDESNQHIGTDAGWDTAPGNSCATSIRHAWQQISPSIEYGYSADMMPYYAETGVLAVGDIDWSCYNGKNTNTIVSQHDPQVIFQAYAQMLPGDSLVRYLDTGGHALMLTKEVVVTYNSDGTINPDASYLFLTEQNNLLNQKREYPSSWTVDGKTSFTKALQDGYLPVTSAELRDGKTPTPVFELTMQPTVSAVQKGTVKGTVKSNYCINTVRMEVFSGDTVVASAETHPYKRTCGFSALGKTLNITSLPAGKYTLVITAEVGLGSQTLVIMEFLMSGATAASASVSEPQDPAAAIPMQICWIDEKRTTRS